MSLPYVDSRQLGAGMVYLLTAPTVATSSAFDGSIALLYGALDNAQAGSAVVSSDVDHDGYLDLIIGAPGEKDNRGSAYVIRGPVAGNTVLYRGAGGRIIGEDSGDAFAASLAVLPSGELLVGAPDSGQGAGAVYQLWGPLSGVALARDGHRIDGAVGSSFGSSLAVAPGRGWVVVGAPTDDNDVGSVHLLEIP